MANIRLPLAPVFTAQATGDQIIDLKKLRGKNVVLYFYPKDNTSGCTLEAQNFRDHYSAFNRFNTLIFGVSRDSLLSHEKFKKKLALPFELITDEQEKLCELYDVIKMKNNYGKLVRGIERSTFLINTQGKLVQTWRKVKVAGHVLEILAQVKTLNN